ncbi:MAG: thermonuclease family protein [Gammaproteobacteria bacterium]|nr:thermonuclease family protein [Gammaproteobacteria bacterium]
MNVLTRSILLCGVLVAGAVSAAQDHGSASDPRSGYFYGRATKVVDGDTLSMKTAEGKPLRVRVAEIDAPEKGEPFSKRARQALNQIIWNQDLAIRLYDIDSYGRIVGHVFVGATDAGRELVRDGLAVVYRRYSTDASLLDLERQAREAKLNIWSQAQIPRGARDESTEVSESIPAGCADKKYCRQMRSCAEALFYLRECGVTSLDGDNDGLPCEAKLCKN